MIQKSCSELLPEHEFDILIKNAISKKGADTEPEEEALRGAGPGRREGRCEGRCLEVTLHKLHGVLRF